MKESDIRDTVVLDEYLSMVEKDIHDFFDPALLEDVSCPACLSDDHAPEFKKSGFQYVSCNKCSTLFVNPRPAFAALNRFYSSSPSTSFWVNRFFKPMVETRRAKIFAPRAKHVSELLGKSGNVVVGDIGAGFGLFLEEMRSLAPHNEYVAIEPSVEMAEICKGKDFKTLRLCAEEIEGMDASFDMLTAFELLEHLFDPASFLLKVRALMKPGGRLLLTTLNGRGFDILLLWNRSKSITPPHHLNFFNPGSMNILLERCGFKPVTISTPGRLDWDIVENMIKREGLQLGRFWNLLAYTADDKCKDEFQDWISDNNLSSHMEALAER